MAKPKLALIPAAQGTKFYSVLPSDGVGDFQFSRLSSATRIAPTGLIETVPIATSRLNYDLLNGKVVNCPHYLLEPASTNLIPYSEDFSNAAWNKINGVTVQLSDVNSPDGTLTNSKIIVGSGTSDFGVYDDVSTLSGSKYVISIFAKKGTTKYIRLREGYSSSQIVVNLENGVVVSDVNASDINIENYGNDWYRLSYKFTAASTAQVVCYIHDNENNSSYTGNGQYLYLYGASIEKGTYPTSYIPTNGTAISRIAETADFSGNAATFNDSEGVLYAEIAALANDGTNRQISISDGSTSQRVYFGFRTTSNEFLLSSRDSSYVIGTLNVLNYNKYSFQYKSGNFKAFVNGFNYALDADGGLLPSGLDRLNFDDGSGATDFYGNTRELQYFDSALTDAQLETLTSWTSLQEMITSQLYTNY